MSVAKLLSDENIQQLSPGRRFYRVFWRSVSPKAYTVGGNSWRFSPFTLSGQTPPIQGLYFADTPSACLRETVFRKGQTGVLPLSAVLHRQCIEVALKTDLTVYLMTSELLEATLGFDPLMSNDYPVCLALAKVLADKFPSVQGILFQSYQTNANTLNLVVFSHNTSAANFRFMRSTRDDILSARYRADLLVAASGAGRELSSQGRDICLGRVALANLRS